jgi:hypothetical protein
MKGKKKEKFLCFMKSKRNVGGLRFWCAVVIIFFLCVCFVCKKGKGCFFFKKKK